jgi:hypothetical protein
MGFKFILKLKYNLYKSILDPLLMLYLMKWEEHIKSNINTLMH